MDMLGDEEVWAIAGILVDIARVGAETAGHVSNSMAQDPPVTMEHVAPKASLVMEEAMDVLSWHSSVQGDLL